MIAYYVVCFTRNWIPQNNNILRSMFYEELDTSMLTADIVLWVSGVSLCASLQLLLLAQEDPYKIAQKVTLIKSAYSDCCIIVEERSFVSLFCGHFHRTRRTASGHLRSFAVICGHLRSFPQDEEDREMALLLLGAAGKSKKQLQREAEAEAAMEAAARKAKKGNSWGKGSSAAKYRKVIVYARSSGFRCLFSGFRRTETARSSNGRSNSRVEPLLING
eukprot:8035855-Pyramimonas_sp.AAC.1